MAEFGEVTEELKYYATLRDGGPLYTEFNPDWIIVEPWNAISSLFIALPAFLWFLHFRKKGEKDNFLYLLLSLLFLGGLGSALFHAFRSSYALLLMDVIPPAIMTLLVGIYFWWKILPHWSYILGVVSMMIVLRYGVFLYFSPHTANNLSYAITGLSILLPLTVILYRTGFQQVNAIILSVGALGLSLVFREIDAWEEVSALSMGTHFIWHILSGVGAWYLIGYLYFIKGRPLKKPAVTGF